LFAGPEHPVQVIAAHNVPQHQHSGQHAQPAGASHRQCHACAPTGILAVVPVADQQKREQAGQFPEKCQLEDVAREHHAHHRAHEGQEE